MTEFKNVSESVQVGLDTLGSVEIRTTVPGSKPRSVTICILDVSTLIFALNDLLDEGRERAHVYVQRYLNHSTLSEASNVNQSSAR